MSSIRPTSNLSFDTPVFSSQLKPETNQVSESQDVKKLQEERVTLNYSSNIISTEIKNRLDEIDKKINLITSKMGLINQNIREIIEEGIHKEDLQRTLQILEKDHLDLNQINLTGNFEKRSLLGYLLAQLSSSTLTAHKTIEFIELFLEFGLKLYTPINCSDENLIDAVISLEDGQSRRKMMNYLIMKKDILYPAFNVASLKYICWENKQSAIRLLFELDVDLSGSSSLFKHLFHYQPSYIKLNIYETLKLLVNLNCDLTQTWRSSSNDNYKIDIFIQILRHASLDEVPKILDLLLSATDCDLPSFSKMYLEKNENYISEIISRLKYDKSNTSGKLICEIILKLIKAGANLSDVQLQSLEKSLELEHILALKEALTSSCKLRT